VAARVLVGRRHKRQVVVPWAAVEASGIRSSANLS
jgi:hypothetical protein